MNKNTSSPDDSRIRDCKEVAAFIARGLAPAEVAQKVDLPVGYVNELTRLPEFEPALKHVGGDEAVQSWHEYALDKAAGASLRAKVRARMDDYFDILDAIASNDATKPETRFAVIKELFAQAKIADDPASTSPPELPRSFFTSLAEAMQEMDHWEAKRVA